MATPTVAGDCACKQRSGRVVTHASPTAVVVVIAIINTSITQPCTHQSVTRHLPESIKRVSSSSVIHIHMFRCCHRLRDLWSTEGQWLSLCSGGGRTHWEQPGRGSSWRLVWCNSVYRYPRSCFGGQLETRRLFVWRSSFQNVYKASFTHYCRLLQKIGLSAGNQNRRNLLV